MFKTFLDNGWIRLYLVAWLILICITWYLHADSAEMASSKHAESVRLSLEYSNQKAQADFLARTGADSSDAYLQADRIGQRFDEVEDWFRGHERKKRLLYGALIGPGIFLILGYWVRSGFRKQKAGL